VEHGLFHVEGFERREYVGHVRGVIQMVVAPTFPFFLGDLALGQHFAGVLTSCAALLFGQDCPPFFFRKAGIYSEGPLLQLFQDRPALIFLSFFVVTF
jgi:hypothetical protein